MTPEDDVITPILAPLTTTFFPVTDTDLWALYSVLEHAKQTGYLENNLDWCDSMQARIDSVRELLSQKKTPKRRGKLPQALVTHWPNF